MNLMRKYLEKMESPNLVGNPKVVPLKSEVSLPATRQDLQTLFEQADAEAAAAYIPGTLRWVERVHPELWAAMQEAEDSINALWLKARTETVDLETFRNAVNRWKAHHLTAREKCASTLSRSVNQA